MKKKLLFILSLINLSANAQRSELYVKSDVYQHTQADVDAQWQVNYDLAKTAWDYYYKADYKTAIYYADRVSTAIIDKDYLYTQKTQIMCLSYAKLGEKKKALDYYKKVKKKSPPKDIENVEKVLRSLQLITTPGNKKDSATVKLYYVPDSSDPTGMHNFRLDGQ